MKRMLLLILFFCFLADCEAQKDSTIKKWNNKIIVSVSGGVAQPFGVFSEYEKAISETVYYRNIGGVAVTGYNYRFDFSYLFSKHFGVCAMYDLSINKTTNPPYSQLGPQKYTYSGGLGGGGGSFSQITGYDSKNWSIKSYFVGMYFTTNWKRVNLSLRISGGLQEIKTPESHLFESGYPGGTAAYSFKSDTKQPNLLSRKPAGSIGLALSINITKRFKFFLALDNFFSQAKFSGKQTIYEDRIYYNGDVAHYENESSIAFTKNVFFYCFNGGITYAIK